MKPIRLTMNAFGPYKDKETIDFEKLQDHQLFVISGPTGSGKTLIFDAISFALYGEASGEDRENVNLLRSHFAGDDDYTSVDFMFEQHGRRYRVFRQLAHRKEGNKHAYGDKCEFYEIIDGEETPAVDRQLVSEVNPKIESLIGLTQDQFKQIVMLPQGEFRKLLTSETVNKEEILRRIFKTEKYERMSERLGLMRDELRKDHEAVKHQLDSYIEQIQAILPARDESPLFQLLAEDHYNPDQLLTALHEEIDFYKRAYEADQKATKKAHEQYQRIQNVYHEAKTIAEQFDDLEGKQKTYKRLLEQEKLYKQKEEQLNQGQKALQITPYEEQVMSWENSVREAKTALTETTRIKVEVEKALKQAIELEEKEQDREDERENTRRRLLQLETLFPTVKDIDREQTELKKEHEALQKLESYVKEERKSIEKNEENLNELFECIQKDDQKVEKLQDVSNELRQAREHWKQLKHYLELQINVNNCQKSYNDERSAYEKLEEQFNRLEQSWLANQAVVLAGHLQDGEACPVCGSLEHPNKAVEGAKEVSREELEEKRTVLRKKKEIFDQISIDLHSFQNQLNMQKSIIEQEGFPAAEATEAIKKVQKRGEQLKKQEDDLNRRRKQLREWKEKYQKDEKDLRKQKENFEKKRENYNEQVKIYERKHAAFEERLKQIPENLRQLSALETEIKKTEKTKEKLEKAWKQAQKNKQRAENERTKIKERMTRLTDQVTKSENKWKEANRQFKEKLKHANFEDEETYRSAKMSVEALDELRTNIESYKQQVHTLSSQIKQLQEQLKDKEKQDVEELSKQVDIFKNKYEQSLQKQNQTKHYVTESENLHQQLEETYENIKDKEKAYANASELYDIVRGQNELRISFERYLQIDYLEQILEAANERLFDMSNGQYVLKHSDRQEAYGRQSGLALDVYDAYTGLDRDVKTLSGGEKFNASLCLALGVSDIIQSHQGNVVIDTMFIDEGFGSLDDETLQKAIQTIIGLQETGRMIGVISHVQELKDAFPAVLQVEKSLEGHSQTKFIID